MRDRDVQTLDVESARLSAAERAAGLLGRANAAG
jgi:hypothetical protein